MLKVICMKRSVLIALLFFFIGSGPLAAQFIPFDNYSVTEALERKRLPGNFINDIEQDQLGYLWLGTQAGAIRYDGYNFDPLTVQNGLPDNEVTDIFIDSRNRVWIATLNGDVYGRLLAHSSRSSLNSWVSASM